MKNIRVFLSKNFPFLEVKFSIHLNRRVFVMRSQKEAKVLDILITELYIYIDTVNFAV